MDDADVPAHLAHAFWAVRKKPRAERIAGILTAFGRSDMLARTVAAQVAEELVRYAGDDDFEAFEQMFTSGGDDDEDLDDH